ncbi:hypothetical protein [Catellatospora sichuanensis]|uniref:hypothetical protein n=1 Tax=Catellatospora sichuanensis TaxID=1969805 RepID=UPI001181CE72|nr:hypothetical protein [Catellatospora sichuanensis]
MLLENRTPAEVAALLGGRLSAVVRSERDAAAQSVPNPSVGSGGAGWTVLVDPHFAYGDADSLLSRWSSAGRVVRLDVIERERFSHATVWIDGVVAWEVSFEEELDERPTASANIPFDLERLAAAVSPVRDAETWYRVPILAARLVTGWHPRRNEARGDRAFAEVIVPGREGRPWLF